MRRTYPTDLSDDEWEIIKPFSRRMKVNIPRKKL